MPAPTPVQLASEEEARFIVRLATAESDSDPTVTPNETGTDRLMRIQSALRADAERVTAQAGGGAADDTPNFIALREMSSGALVVRAPKSATAEQALRMAGKLAGAPQVLSVEPDARVSSFQVAEPSTNDPFLASQWALRSGSAVTGGANFRNAWNRTRGANVTVAVIDTGVVPHPDLAGRLVPGFDFISDPTTAGDGTGRDSDPTDPGDFCGSTPSSWHGTAVASQIAAVSNNGYGIVGAAPLANILPVRVIGRCGGWLSDTADALAWLARQPVSGAPTLTTRVQVANLSLGGHATCFQYMQDAVNAALRAGITVVAASGNAAGAVSAPANCQGVIAVAAGNASGDIAHYANFGAQVALLAPGGGACRSGVALSCDSAATLAAGVIGTQTRAAFAETRSFSGTSAAAPHVAAAAALLYAINPSITPAQVRSVLQTSARRFASNGYCSLNPGACGAGLLDAGAAVDALAGALPSVTVSLGTGITRGTASSTQEGLIARGATGTLNASVVNAPGASFSWRQVAGPSAVLSNVANGVVNGPTLTLRAPADQSGLMSFEVVAVAGTQTARTTIAVRVNNPPALPVSLPPARVRTAYSFALPGADIDGDRLTYTVLTAPSGMTISADGRIVWSRPTLGTATVRVRASDSFGQTTDGDWTLPVTNAAPIVPSVSLLTHSGVPWTGTVGAADPEGGALSFTVSGLPAGMSFSPATQSFAWAQPVVGRYVMTIAATDPEGARSSGTLTLDVVQANRAPAVQTTALAGRSGTALSAQVQATDPDGDALSFQLGSAPSGMSLSSSGRLSWPNPAVGTYVLQITVRDGRGGVAIAPVRLTITRS